MSPHRLLSRSCERSDLTEPLSRDRVPDRREHGRKEAPLGREYSLSARPTVLEANLETEEWRRRESNLRRISTGPERRRARRRLNDGDEAIVGGSRIGR
jgi:hypothetical protein